MSLAHGVPLILLPNLGLIKTAVMAARKPKNNVETPHTGTKTSHL